jgi:hypothetical protein
MYHIAELSPCRNTIAVVHAKLINRRRGSIALHGDILNYVSYIVKHVSLYRKIYQTEVVRVGVNAVCI